MNIQVYREFRILFEQWTKINITLTGRNTDRKLFETQQTKFYKESLVLEQKISSVLAKAFEDCNNLEQVVKVFLFRNKNSQTFSWAERIPRGDQFCMPFLFFIVSANNNAGEYPPTSPNPNRIKNSTKNLQTDVK